MKVLVIGGGGREHALIWRLSRSPRVRKLYALPGNGGIQEIAQTEPIASHDLDGILYFVKRERVDLTVVGPELPLTLGIVDRFEREGLAIVGPRANAAEIEGSKVFSKGFMQRHGIPTAEGEVVTSPQEAIDLFKRRPPPYVIKAEGLAAGKGVAVAQSEREGRQVVEAMMLRGSLGDAGKRLVIEECLVGEEVSFMVLTDGERLCPLLTAQDYKRVGEGEEGPNTGGMGAYAPAPLMSATLQERVMREVMTPAIRGLAEEGRPYRGILYAGLMVSPASRTGGKNGYHVLEFNARLGDPETQAILPLLASDLLDPLLEISQGQLKRETLVWERKKAITVILASKGYPGSYESGKEILGLSHGGDGNDVLVFHGGTQREGGRWYTQGGRVLAVTAVGDSFQQAHERVYGAVEKITFDGAHYRRDIGKRVIDAG